MPAWFYILRLQSGRLYPGSTTDLADRLSRHQSGRAGRTTAIDPPNALVYQEEHATFSAARRREAQVKRWSAKKKEALVVGDKSGLRQLAVSHDHAKSTSQNV
jgi:predicted GIY-YIG superfamily endonuclease